MPAETIAYSLPRVKPDRLLDRATAVFNHLTRRRSCRAFSAEPVPQTVIETLIAAAGTAPSGANRQPWRFVAVSDPDLKREIRLAAEAEERENYDRRMPQEWLDALEPLGTGPEKPFLEIAPWLVVVFRIDFEMHQGRRIRSYYPIESAMLAAGLFLAACHEVGLATLTHTPSPMKFLRDLLGRPESEVPMLLIPVGYPAADCRVPDIRRKPLEDILIVNPPRQSL